MSYTAVIRTLGTSGGKYYKLLKSLDAQTVLPIKILVYLPFGYSEPKETIVKEQIVRCKKGMVAQRSLPFDEVETEWMLFLDDDMELPPEMVEIMLKEAERQKVDAVVPDCYHLNNLSWKDKIIGFLYNNAVPRKDDGWSLKIKSDGSYSYNAHPHGLFLPTQTGPFACLLVRKKAFRQIHFEDERWLDQFAFAFQDDQLFFYKLHICGYKTLMYFNSGLKHLDARSGIRPDVTKRMFCKKLINYVIWYRTIYCLADTRGKRQRARLYFLWRNIVNSIAMLIDVIRYKKINYIKDYFLGLRAGKAFVHSEKYLDVPRFDSYVKIEP